MIKYLLHTAKIEDLLEWINENNLLVKNFYKEKQIWQKENSKEKEPNFFSDTELILIFQDFILLKTINEDHSKFLVKSYQLEYQNVCQKLFKEKKNVIIIDDRQWKVKLESSNKKIFILFKDEESIKKSLKNWLEKTENLN